jgi:signal peptidase II
VQVGFVAGAIVVLDQLTKRWVLETLAPGACSQPDACIDLVWTLRLNLVFNSGASFGTGQTLGPFIGIVSFGMAALMLWLGSRTRSPAQRLIYAAIAGGALGNGLDRLFRADEGFMTGAVVDFIDLQWWPVFNVADTAIVVSVIAAVVLSFLGAEEPDEPEADPS